MRQSLCPRKRFVWLKTQPKQENYPNIAFTSHAGGWSLWESFSFNLTCSNPSLKFWPRMTQNKLDKKYFAKRLKKQFGIILNFRSLNAHFIEKRTNFWLSGISWINFSLVLPHILKRKKIFILDNIIMCFTRFYGLRSSQSTRQCGS